MASEKKRKRQSDGLEGSATKKVAFKDTNDTVKVSVIETEKQWQPIIASSPGFTFQQSAKFKAYTGGDYDASRGLFLHSDSHPTLDYTAREEAHDPTEPLAHYVGIYDPQKQTLELLAAREMTIRSTLKTSRFSDAEAQTEAYNHESPQKKSTRSDLGLAFGTKKSKKIIEARAANAIVSTKPLSEDKVATAILDSMNVTSAKKQELQERVDAARPIPPPNAAAAIPAEVYSTATLVGNDEFLAKFKVKDWIDVLKAGGDIRICVRAVAYRMQNLATRGDVKRMRILRYLHLLILWYRSLRPPKHSRETSMYIPKFGELSLTHNTAQQPYMAELMREYGHEFLPHLADKFSKDGYELTRWHVDRLVSYILAINLVIDDFELDSADIQHDLQFDVKKVAEYFKGLGCTARPFNKREVEHKLSQHQMRNKLEATERKKIILKIPLKLPTGRGFASRRN